MPKHRAIVTDGYFSCACNEKRLWIIDIREEIFKKEQNPLKLFPFELNGHYNVEGYKKVAETIYKFTKD